MPTVFENVQFKNFFGYNFWVAAGLAISAIPFDSYILVKTAGPVATGLFAAPMKILTTTYQFAGGFSRVLAPRYSSFENNQKAIEFSKKSILIVGAVIAGLGASAVLVGRPAVWGLANAGAAGVAHVLRLLRDELEIAMALTGCATLAEASPALLDMDPAHFKRP